MKTTPLCIMYILLCVAPLYTATSDVYTIKRDILHRLEGTEKTLKEHNPTRRYPDLNTTQGKLWTAWRSYKRHVESRLLEETNQEGMESWLRNVRLNQRVVSVAYEKPLHRSETGCPDSPAGPLTPLLSALNTVNTYLKLPHTIYKSIYNFSLNRFPQRFHMEDFRSKQCAKVAYMMCNLNNIDTFFTRQLQSNDINPLARGSREDAQRIHRDVTHLRDSIRDRMKLPVDNVYESPMEILDTYKRNAIRMLDGESSGEHANTSDENLRTLRADTINTKYNDIIQRFNSYTWDIQRYRNRGNVHKFTSPIHGKGCGHIDTSYITISTLLQ